MIREGVMISGRYEMMGRIGVGGMADVYKAIDRKLNRYVAVKVLKREFREDATFVQKFQTEAQSAAGLLHPNIVNVYDVGEDRGLYYIVMELVEGITLKDYIQKKGRLTAKEVISVAMQVCAGIESAHSNDIIHRDIKPQNIIISKEGKVKVTDFGIAKATSSNTISTNAMGSVHYTSPEQARGGFSDAKSDIYSLGITMYEMITGELPFDGDSTVAVALKHLQEDITAPSELVDDIPYSLERIILKCTQKSPDRRYSDVSLLARDLKRSLAEPDGDFVVIAPFVSAADTRMMSQEEMDTIKRAAASRQSQYEDDDDYDYDYDDEDDDEYERRRAKRRKAAEKKEIDPNMAKIMKILTIVVTVIFIFILIFVVGKAAGFFGDVGPGIKESEEKLEVPELVGKTEEEAKEECEELGLVLKVIDTKLSEEYDKGYVIEQRTQAGTQAKEGTIVNVVVSEGLKGEEVKMPQLKNYTEAEAKEELIELGFKEKNIEVVERTNDEVESGLVFATDPTAGLKTTVDAKVTIYVSLGKEQVFVPRIEGKTKEEAEALLAERELVGEAEEVFSDAPVGEVIKQEIEANEEVDKGTTIKYQVSKGKEKVTIPTGLKGKSYSSVKATLSNLDLVPNPRYEESAEYKDGYVIFVEGEGLEVDAGSTVTVVISTGSTTSQEPSEDSSTTNPSTEQSGTEQGATTP